MEVYHKSRPKSKSKKTFSQPPNQPTSPRPKHAIPSSVYQQQNFDELKIEDNAII